VGERQVFIRFAGCNLSCQYCDTPQALSVTEKFRVEFAPGSHTFQTFKNPVSLDQLMEIVGNYTKHKAWYHSLVLTGGEPLLQVDFLKIFLKEFKGALPVYLETNGVLPQHLEELIDFVDIISFDIKLSSATGLSDYYKEHKKALEIAYMKEVFVKIVFTKDTKIKEIDEATEIIASIDDKIPLILQPATPRGSIKSSPKADQIFPLFNVAKRRLKNVRVISQIHKVLGIL